MSPHLISPSLLSCDFLKIGEEVKMLNESKADWLHLDVMDGSFVPNISFGLPIISAVKKISRMPLDVHLMIVNPEKYISDFRNAGADHITVHYEACTHLHRTLHQIKETGTLAGVALNPHTPVEVLFDVLEDVDLVIMMSVNPGFGGQKFIYRSLDKIKRLRKEIIERNLNTLIEVDGGVGLQNAEAILSAGAQVLVAGNAVFNTPDPSKTIHQFKMIEIGNFV
ncbi:MAG: ribulose-phosphate 3-epimerase [Saprospiraceae bacterium]|nr:ribulose-phosphate 3-epimerase [Saprospiraceae bacterium]MBK7812721.1 ribulose-phosphate 3-epimerase [Saprospiraceae bacterium]MBK9630912.1 ribulose-phosphate 3-epimerase [Saprospiraceae bacterium]